MVLHNKLYSSSSCLKNLRVYFDNTLLEGCVCVCRGVRLERGVLTDRLHVTEYTCRSFASNAL